MLIDFAAIPTRRKPNTALAVPRAWQRADTDLEMPVFPVPVDRLREAVMALANREPRTTLRHLDEDASQAEFEQVSRVFRFPDRITVAFIAVDAGHSTLAIYSRARIGYADFGVNKRRVHRWRHALARELGAVTT